MLYILAIFCPPLYFLIRKKFVRFVITAIGFVSVPFLIVLPPVAIVLALSLVFSALHDLRKEQVKQDAEVLATRLAEKIAATRTPAVDAVVQTVLSVTPSPPVREEKVGSPMTSVRLSGSSPTPPYHSARETSSLKTVVAEPTAIFCEECGARQESDARVCADCGATL